MNNNINFYLINYHMTEQCLDEDIDEWIPKRDKEYYGLIPKNVTIELLLKIMVIGLYNVVIDSKKHKKMDHTSDSLLDLFDLWCEHDEYHKNHQQFQHLITDDICDEFLDKLEAELIKLKIVNT